MYCLQVRVRASPGGGTGASVCEVVGALGSSGADGKARVVVVVLRGGPASVVIATAPSVVRPQPTAAAATTTSAAATRTRVLIGLTIGVRRVPGRSTGDAASRCCRP